MLHPNTSNLFNIMLLLSFYRFVFPFLVSGAYTFFEMGLQAGVVYPRARVDPYLDLLKPSQKLG